MTKWNASQYLRYGSERTRAAADLVARINLDAPRNIADVGCGPGNSTSLLWERWPESNVLGMDNSPEMIDTARTAFPERQWSLCDASNWNPQRSFDLLYSNAALQWLPNHGPLLRRLFGHVTEGGALAFQIPSATYAVVRELIFDISRKTEWNERMTGPRSILTMEPPAFYYDTLMPVQLTYGKRSICMFWNQNRRLLTGSQAQGYARFWTHSIRTPNAVRSPMSYNSGLTTPTKRAPMVEFYSRFAELL